MQDTVCQIVSTRAVNRQHGQSIILSLPKAGSCISVWACGMLTKRVAAKPDGGGELAVICKTNSVVNEQDWKSVQFISTANVLIICKLFKFKLFK